MIVAPGPMEMVMVVAQMLGGWMNGGVPLAVPPQPERTEIMAMAPDECVAYVSSSGMATPDPESENQVEQLLAEPQVREFADEAYRVINQLLKREMDEVPADTKLFVRDSVLASLTRPWAFHLTEVSLNPADLPAGGVIHLGEDAEDWEDRILLQLGKLPEEALTEKESDAGTYYVVKIPDAPVKISWGRFLEEYLVVALGESGFEKMTARADTPAPAWLTEIGETLPIERRSSIFYADAGKILATFKPLIGTTMSTIPDAPDLKTVLDGIGLDNVDKLIAVTGLDDTNFRQISRLSFKGEPEGLIDTLTSATMDAEDLALVPADANLAYSVSVDLEKMYHKVLLFLQSTSPPLHEEVSEGLAEMQLELGINLKEDLLSKLGTNWCVYNSPSEGGLFLTGLTLVVELDDPEGFRATEKKLLHLLPQLEPRTRGLIEEVSFQDQHYKIFSIPEEEVPFAPSWCILGDRLIVSLVPQNIKTILARDDAFESLADREEIAALLDGDHPPMQLTHADFREYVKIFYPFLPYIAQVATAEMREEGISFDTSKIPTLSSILPHLSPNQSVTYREEHALVTDQRQCLPMNSSASVPMAAALLLPAIQSSRQAARRMQSINNLKQIGLALHNYHDTFNQFPPAYLGTEEKPLLSWRVAILPFIGQSTLYDQFHLDEPWDSEHNLPLSKTVVGVYQSPLSQDRLEAPWMTTYQTVRHPDSPFPGGEKISLRDLNDGTSNTIMVLEVAPEQAVPWTKPDDFEPDPEEDLCGWHPVENHLIFAMCDGSVHHELVRDFVSRLEMRGESAEEILMLLFQRNDGQPIPW